MNKNDTDIVGWMTVKGVHIPIRKGQSREKAMTEFLKGADSQNPFQDRAKLPEKISLPDETLPHSIGAKWANYDIQMEDGTTGHLQEGSKLHHKEVFAGKGCKREIDEVEGLVSKYGGKAENWQKVKAVGKIVKEDGEIEECEIHWYEEPTAGKVKLKVKKK